MDYTDLSVQAGIVIGLAEIYKRIGLPTKLVPLVDLFLGLSISILTGLTISKKTIPNCVLDGILVGLMACGLYSGIKNIVEE